MLLPKLPQAFRTCAASEKKGGGSEGSSGKQEGQMMQRKGGEDVEQYSGGPSSTFFGAALATSILACLSAVLSFAFRQAQAITYLMACRARIMILLVLV